MPLLKLWNAMWGRSAGDTPVAEPTASPTPTPTPAVPASKPATLQVSKTLSSGFGLFGSNPHGALCKQVAAIQAKSVLEVAVGDGSRAIAVMGTLAKTAGPVRYYGIDQFELAGGSVSRFFIGLTPGYYKNRHSVEDVRDNFDLIRNEEGYIVPEGPQDELTKLLGLLSSED